MFSSRLKLCLAVFFVLALLLAGCTQQSAPEDTGASAPTAPVQKPAAPVAQTPSAPSAPAAPSMPAPEKNISITPVIEQKNETPIVTEPAKPAPVIVRGTPDADFSLMVYDENRSQIGTTLFADNHISGHPRIVEVNALGEILWKYEIPSQYAQYTNPGFDIEPLANGNILYVLPRKGVFEINREGTNVWSYFDAKVSHDADRLANGNTLIAYGANDQKSDAQAKEVNPSGQVVWSYKASNDFDKSPYSSISDEGWTHANSVSRLANGNTLISFRNFDLLAEVNPSGELVRTISLERFRAQHDPAVQPNGNILIANHVNPNEVFEFTPEGEVIFNFTVQDRRAAPVRDANRLSNGNILITGADRIFEITSEGEPVWGLKLQNVAFTKETAAGLGFYKAERLEK